MEIRYKRTYSPAKGKRYTAGEINAMLGYAVEVADPRVQLQEGKLAPGEVCLLLFGLAPEEYALKDENPKELDSFVELLVRFMPADRLIGWRVMNLKGEQVQKNIRPKLLRESMDEGAFARKVRKSHAGPIDEKIQQISWLQKKCADKNAPEEDKQNWAQAKRALGEALLGLEKLYAVDEALLNGKWPAVGLDGRVELFTTRERAENIKPQIAAVHGGVETWAIREIPAGEIEGYLRRCSMEGMNLLRVDNGFGAAQLRIGDFMEEVQGENILLRNFIIREIELGVRWNKMKEVAAPEKNLRGALEGALSLKNFVRREIGNATLYAICMNGARERCVILGKKDAGEKMLGVYTDRIRAAAFAEKLEGNLVPVAMNFDELEQNARRNGCCLVIDGDVLGYRVPAAEFDTIRDLRGKPPVVVRLQPPQDKAETPPPVRAVQSDMGSLPNPDDFDVPAKPRVDEAPTEEPLSQPETEPQKKSFFRKLFKK